MERATAAGAEIRQYLQSVADKYDIRKYISFNKEVCALQA